MGDMTEVSTHPDHIETLFGRYVHTVLPSVDRVREMFASGARLRFYFGIDPTGPHIHLGHSTNLLWLKKLHALGHEILLLVGDFTARIGDPSDKTSVRQALTKEDVEENMKTYTQQIERILPAGTFEVHYNSTWLANLTLEETIRLMSHGTVQQMIQRDMFQERLKAEKPIFLHEFLYPLLQGYDSVALRTDGELCGNDQTFNALVGRDLERAILGKEKVVITTKLLEDPETGKKIMNKSEGTAIYMDDPPQEIRRKVLALDDRVVTTVFELCTEVRMEEIQKYTAQPPRVQKEALSDELVRMYHGEEMVEQARQAREESLAGMPLDKGLVVSGIVSTATGGRRLIDQGAVEINNVPVKEWKYELRSGDEVRVGKGKFMKVK
jgi:tyrosyl-tRNA synthetase